MMKKLLFFHASWCPPCRFVEREFVNILSAMVGDDKVIKINAQEEPQTAEKYRVDKLPAIVVIDDDKVIYRRLGGFDVERVADMLND